MKPVRRLCKKCIFYTVAGVCLKKTKQVKRNGTCSCFKSNGRG